MDKLLAELKLKADNCNNTKEGRARRGAYVDCIVMINQVKNCNTPDVSKNIYRCDYCEKDISEGQGIHICRKCSL